VAETALLSSRSEQWIFAGPDVILGEFHCPPERPEWNVPNVIGEWPLITFPATSCWIEQAGRDPMVADRATSIFYNPFTEYRRGLLDPLGDHCTYLVPSPALLAEATAVWDPSVGEHEVRFDWATGPIDHRTYLLQHEVRRHVVTEPAPDPLYATESLYRLLGQILGNALRLHRDPDRPGDPTGPTDEPTRRSSRLPRPWWRPDSPTGSHWRSWLARCTCRRFIWPGCSAAGREPPSTDIAPGSGCTPRWTEWTPMAETWPTSPRAWGSPTTAT
jgi:hypothetical protein